MENQVDLFHDHMETREILYQQTPEITAIQKAMIQETYKDGALSTKHKRLMALAMSLQTGCVPCMLSQAKQAIEAGATRAEVLEATSVARCMCGTQGIANSIRIGKFLEDVAVK
jgi:AhpD family alkylhydroperoxidase